MTDTMVIADVQDEREDANCPISFLPACATTRVQKTQRELGQAGDMITAITAHPDQDLVLVGTLAGNLLVWDVSRGESVSACQAHSRDITKITFFRDGRFATISVDGTVQIWSQSFEKLHFHQTGVGLYSAAINPKTSELAVGGQDRVVRVLDAVSGSVIHQLEGQPDAVTALHFLSNGHLFVGGADGSIRVWEVDQKRCVRQFRGHQSHIAQAIGSKSSWYVTGSWDQSVKVWNGHHRERFALPAGPQAVTGIDMSANQRLLAVVHWDGSVRIFNMETGKTEDEFVAHDESLMGCCFVAGDRQLVTADQVGRLRAWQVEEFGQVRHINQHTGEVYCVRPTPDNLQILSAGYDGILRVWDRADREEVGSLETHLGPTTAIAIAPDNLHWLIGGADGTIRIWNSFEQTIDANMPAHQQTVTDLVFLPDGNKFVSSSWDMKLKVWFLDSHSLDIAFDGHSGEVSGCDVSLDGRVLLSSSWDGTARLWDLVNRRRDVGIELRTLHGHSERVLCCALHPSGQWAATGGADQILCLWPIDQKRPSGKVLTGHPAAVTACRFSPDGTLLLSADRSGFILIWDALEGKPLGSVHHKCAIHSLTFSRDGSQVIIGDELGMVRFLSIHRETGPKWLAANTILKKPSLWKRGAPLEEHYEVHCIYCGRAEGIKAAQLGNIWSCAGCRQVLHLCPRSLPPISADGK